MEEDHWHGAFEGVNYDGEPVLLATLHHWDSGGLSIIIGAEETTCYLEPDEWLRLLNWLLTNQKLRNWIDRRKEAKESQEIMDRLKLFEQVGLEGRDLLHAALPPK